MLFSIPSLSLGQTDSTVISRDVVRNANVIDSLRYDSLVDKSTLTTIEYKVYLQVITVEESKEITLSKTFKGDQYSFLNRQKALQFLYDLATSCSNDDLIAVNKQMEYDVPDYKSYALAIFAELPDESLMLYGMSDFREQMRALNQERQYYMKTADPYIGDLELFVLEGHNGERPKIYTTLPASSYENYMMETYEIKKLTFSSDTTDLFHWSNLDNYSELFPLEDYPDDLQVIVFDGPNREYKPGAEFMWVQGLGSYKNFYIGYLLNHPKDLKDWEFGDLVIFKMGNGEDDKPMIFSPEQLMKMAEL